MLEEQNLPDLTLQEFATKFRLHPEYVRKLAVEGRLPGAYRLLGGWRIRREAAEQIRNPITPATLPEVRA